jgi:uncharacterized DUF497 family protein
MHSGAWISTSGGARPSARRIGASTGVDFADAVEVFYDDLSCSMTDPNHHAAQRFLITGTDAFGRVLLVVYAQPDHQTIRIISARPATPAERRHYEQG